MNNKYNLKKKNLQTEFKPSVSKINIKVDSFNFIG